MSSFDGNLHYYLCFMLRSLLGEIVFVKETPNFCLKSTKNIFIKIQVFFKITLKFQKRKKNLIKMLKTHREFKTSQYLSFLLKCASLVIISRLLLLFTYIYYTSYTGKPDPDHQLSIMNNLFISNRSIRILKINSCFFCVSIKSKRIQIVSYSNRNIMKNDNYLHFDCRSALLDLN